MSERYTDTDKVSPSTSQEQKDNVDTVITEEPVIINSDPKTDDSFPEELESLFSNEGFPEDSKS